MSEPRKPAYDCSKCPAYCCSYEQIEISQRDVNRLARHFGIDPKTAERRFTKIYNGVVVLRHQRDHIYKSVCMFLDRKTRRCTVYESRPGVCRDYPDSSRCGYYDFLRFERSHQADPKFIALT